MSTKDEIQSAADQIKAAVNDNVNAAMSRVIQARDRATQVIAEMQTKMDRNSQRFSNALRDADDLEGVVARLRKDVETVRNLLGDVRDDADELAAIIGQVVTLKSDQTHKMTAAEVAGSGYVRCVWMVEGGFHSEAIPFAALRADAPAAAKRAPARKTSTRARK